MDQFQSPRASHRPDDLRVEVSSACSSPRSVVSMPSSPIPTRGATQAPGLVRQGSLQKSLLCRQLSKKFWQPDREADECSILACDNTFGASILSMRRHHCRHCGRVVCGTCSTGTMMMLPPKGESGPARRVRVCDACLQSEDIFHLKKPETAEKRSPGLGLMGWIKRGSVPDLAAVPSLDSSDLNSPRANDAQSPGGSPKAESAFQVTMRHVVSAPDLATLMQLHRPEQPPLPVNEEQLAEASQASEVGDYAKYHSDDEDSRADTESSSAEGRSTNPMLIKPKNHVKTVPGSEENLLDGLEHDAQIKRLNEIFAQSSYYGGLLAHEPDALRALLVAEASKGSCE